MCENTLKCGLCFPIRRRVEQQKKKWVPRPRFKSGQNRSCPAILKAVYYGLQIQRIFEVESVCFGLSHAVLLNQGRVLRFGLKRFENDGSPKPNQSSEFRFFLCNSVLNVEYL